ncbi:MAG: hypothetical protein CME63_17525 [Halobacteriovoraceae bacterium]|nr:hypothetical protein [Halobacteriovoraceae bacterium]MBC99549.1 hypothetical protein [Halobacteriovoraceae bacterium]|tara:strand:- start:21004 stop:21420 length:417 start_codon:yes stop_codon:yes gene_type:complete
MLDLVRRFLSFFADSSPFKKRGFKTRAHMGDFFVFKKYEDNQRELILYFYQSISPFQPRFREILTEEIPDGVFVLEYQNLETPNLVQETDLYYSFDHVLKADRFWFFYDDHLDFGSPKIELKLEAIENYIDKYLSVGE